MTIPAHIGIIMDGNGRWAAKRGFPRTAGHAAGAENFRKVATYCKELGVKHLTVYAFSTENWKRPAAEVRVIFGLFAQYLLEAVESMERDGVRLRFLGDIAGLPENIRELMRRCDEVSRRVRDGMQANVCVNYGGRDEIVRAARRLAESGTEITEESLSRALDTAGIPDPDLIIRTSGEVRISNFLLWQGAYAEYYVADVLWPDFSPAHLDQALETYAKRERRYGGTG